VKVGFSPVGDAPRTEASTQPTNFGCFRSFVRQSGTRDLSTGNIARVDTHQSTQLHQELDRLSTASN
jgi:hypothetical protein